MRLLLREYIKSILLEMQRNSHVSNQTPGTKKPGEKEEEELEEFSTAAGGSIQGFALPLGMSPDDPILGTKKRKKRKSS